MQFFLILTLQARLDKSCVWKKDIKPAVLLRSII
jgi:hypothetical protein